MPGIYIDPITVPELHGRIESFIAAGSKARIFRVIVRALNPVCQRLGAHATDQTEALVSAVASPSVQALNSWGGRDRHWRQLGI